MHKKKGQCMKNRTIDGQNIKIAISKEELDDYICITDIARAKSIPLGRQTWCEIG